MSAERNAGVVRRWVEEVMSQGHLDVIDEVVAADVKPARLINVGASGVDMRRRIRAYVAAYRNAFPDLRMTVDELIPCNDTVTLCWTSEGTHTGSFSHPEIQSFGLAPTGRPARWSGITLFRIEDGRIVQTRSHGDVYGLLRQLGLVQPPGAAEPGS
jgi:predicted ester cyclase